jgi:hypothetical protein
MLKWLQYETVLGPEDGDVVPRPENVGHRRGSQAVDEEKAVEGKQTGGLAVTGPGLGDLLTEGPHAEVFDLRLPGPNEDRLERIESMLARLLNEPVTPRVSNDTVVAQPVEPKTMVAAPNPTYR